MEGLIACVIPVLIAGLPLIWLIATYNALVRLRNYCRESWSDIDTELKRRHDLIPNLVETVGAYARHERETLERVMLARAAAAGRHDSTREQARDENELVHRLDRLLAVAQAYPQLRASEHFLDLQRELTRTENRIARARRFYNANVRELNTRTQVFPSSIVANLFGFQTRDYFEIDDPQRRGTVEVAW